MTLPIKSISRRQAKARNLLNALIGRASYDKEFVRRLELDTKRTLEEEGMLNNNQSVMLFAKNNPEEFDKVSKALIKTLGSDFWAKVQMLGSTCDTPGTG